jgi:CBS domain-containing protein
VTNFTSAHAVSPRALIDFFEKTLPFSELDRNVLNQLALGGLVDFYPKGQIILQQDASGVDKLYLIQKGAVKIYRVNPDKSSALIDHRGEGSSFGAVALISGSKSTLTVEAVEDTFCFLIGKEPFLETLQHDPIFSQHFFRGLSEGIVDKAYSELRRVKVGMRADEAFHLFSRRIKDVIKKPAEFIGGSESIRIAAKKMTDLEIGSLLVNDSAGDVVGIITDKDLRTKVVASGLNVSEPVEKVMSFPVLKVSAADLCFEALIEMMNRQVHYLGVEWNGKMVGVVTDRDILVIPGNSPLDLLRQVGSQRSIEGLYELSERAPLVVRSLIEEGAKASHITRVITVVNDHILERLLDLMKNEMGPAPVPFCWMVTGSEGRKEQTFRTDQDNAIMYEDPGEEWETVKAAKLYFRRLGNKAIEHLVACGYPLCKGQMMASNSRWRKPYPVWVGYFDSWMSTAEPMETLNAKIFFDFRPAYGSPEIANLLREHLTETAQHSRFVIRHLARDFIEAQTPLSFFRNFMVEKDGEHKNRFDLKLRGLVPFVDFARMMALRYGIKETNTLERLQMLATFGHMSEEMVRETVEAYEFIMQVRLTHQLKMIEAGTTPHNFVDPAQLSDLERMTLKAAFDVINRLQTFVAKLGFTDEY